MPRGVPGRVPKEPASLTNLATLYLAVNDDLHVPGGAQTSNGGMLYHDREAVACFQACLKCIQGENKAKGSALVLPLWA